MLKTKWNTVSTFWNHYNEAQSEKFHPFSILLKKKTKNQVHTSIEKGNKSTYILLH